MAEPIATTMADILPLIETRLRTVTGLPAECVNPWVGDADPPHLQADQDLVLRLMGFAPEEGWQVGAGRLATQVIERLGVQIRTRLALDEPGTRRKWVLDHIDLRDSVIDALEEFVPTAAKGDILTNGAILLDPARPLAPGKGTADWGSETLVFRVPYLLALPTTTNS